MSEKHRVARALSLLCFEWLMCCAVRAQCDGAVDSFLCAPRRHTTALTVSGCGSNEIGDSITMGVAIFKWVYSIKMGVLDTRLY